MSRCSHSSLRVRPSCACSRSRSLRRLGSARALKSTSVSWRSAMSYTQVLTRLNDRQVPPCVSSTGLSARADEFGESRFLRSWRDSIPLARFAGGAMIDGLRHQLLCVSLLAIASAVAAHAQNYTKPKVRAITGFVRLDRASYAPQIAETLAVLREAKREFEKQGYEVETIRIVTQPLGELVSGQSDAEALAFLKVLDELSA